jgi:hypothetical protein
VQHSSSACWQFNVLPCKLQGVSISGARLAGWHLAVVCRSLGPLLLLLGIQSHPAC